MGGETSRSFSDENWENLMNLDPSMGSSFQQRYFSPPQMNLFVVRCGERDGKSHILTPNRNEFLPKSCFLDKEHLFRVLHESPYPIESLDVEVPFNAWGKIADHELLVIDQNGKEIGTTKCGTSWSASLSERCRIRMKRSFSSYFVSEKLHVVFIEILAPYEAQERPEVCLYEIVYSSENELIVRCAISGFEVHVRLLDPVFRSKLLSIESSALSCRSTFPTVFEKCGRLACILCNIISNPDVPKFRTIASNNQRLRNTVFAIDGIELMLEKLGFEKMAEPDGDKWTLPMAIFNHHSLGLLNDTFRTVAYELLIFSIKFANTSEKYGMLSEELKPIRAKLLSSLSEDFQFENVFRIARENPSVKGVLVDRHSSVEETMASIGTRLSQHITYPYPSTVDDGIFATILEERLTESEECLGSEAMTWLS